MKPVWEIMITAITALVDTKNNLMQAIIEVEEQFEKQSFLQRARANSQAAGANSRAAGSGSRAAGTK
jgi:hypothetical protein